MPPTRRLADEPSERAEKPADPAPVEPALLALQRSAGNAAVTRLLARDLLSNALGDAPLAAPNLNLPVGGLDDWAEAGLRVDAYFDEVKKDHRETLLIPGSMAGLVHQACEQEFTLKNGTKLKVGDLIKVSGGLSPEKDGSVGWSASLEIGTIGKLIMPEEVAKVFKGTQETFSKSAGELVKHRDDPAKVKEHGGALVEAVKGDGSAGVSGSVTLTWTW